MSLLDNLNNLEPGQSFEINMSDIIKEYEEQKEIDKLKSEIHNLIDNHYTDQGFDDLEDIIKQIQKEDEEE